MSTNNKNQKRDFITSKNIVRENQKIARTMQPLNKTIHQMKKEMQKAVGPIIEQQVRESQKIARTIQPLIKIQKQIVRDMKPLNKMIHQMQKEMQKALEPILKQQRQFAEFVKKIKEQDNNLREAMLKSGWWWTPSLMRVPARLLQAVNDYQNGNKTAITNLFRKIYQRENCKNLESVVISWKKNKLFSPWQNHIADALDSHKDKKYTLSVPVLLLVAEGIATDFCKKVGIYEKRDMSRGGEKIKKAVQKYYGKSSGLLLLLELSLLELLINAIDTTIYQKTDLIKKKLHTNILNRHAVLHGLKKNYGTMKTSLQAFMLLDVLSKLK